MEKKSDHKTDQAQKRFQGVFIQFENPLDFDFSNALLKAILLFDGVGKGALVLEAEEVSVSPRIPQLENRSEKQ